MAIAVPRTGRRWHRYETTVSAVSDPGNFAVYGGDFADPCLVRVGDAYYAYATNAGAVNVQVMVSVDLHSWQPVGDALPVLPSWAQRGNTWAPAVIQLGDLFVLYYTVREPLRARQCISVATASSPRGQFLDVRQSPLIYQLDHGGSIDPCPFLDDDGELYLVWKSDDNAIGRPSSLWGQRLSADGQELLDSPVQLLIHDRAWEDPLIEAPSLVVSDRTYYLFYSANWWQSDRYGIGYAMARGPLGPYTKATLAGPWMGSDRAVAGPGGQDFCRHGSGDLLMAYHGWPPGRIGYSAGGVRSLYVTRVRFDDGQPVVGR
jgi:beta-xylosidase